MNLATFAIAIAMMMDGTGAGLKAPTPDEQFQALRDAHQAAFDAFATANREAKTPDDEAKVLKHPGRKPRAFAPAFMDLANKYPGSTAAEDALEWVTSHTFQTVLCEEAKRRLAHDFVRSSKLGPALGFQGHYGDFFEGSERFFRKVLEENPDHGIQGLACYWLARHLMHKAEGVRGAKKNPNFGHFGKVDMYKDVYGADWADRLRRLDPEALEREAELLFERVAKYYADIPHNDKRRNPGPLGDAARAYLRAHRELAVGKPAPEIEGVDLDGQKFRLADYRGKVVVLDFGSHFYCGNCRALYPHMRTLTRRLRGRRFSVISINAEPEKIVKDLKDAWTSEGNTWRCIFDGTWEGPIQKAWNIQFFPTIYVLDSNGVIRHKNLQEKALDEAVETLLLEAETAK
jgi:thiol-disulfide isomerase/thioredoxin